MKNTLQLLALVLLSFTGCVVSGCIAEPDVEGEIALADAPTLEAQSFCTATATCWNGTPLACNGNSTCSAQDGNNGYVKCDGQVTNCPPVPCIFNGQTYAHGQSVTAGVRCSSKTDGYCIGGVFAGNSCVANGECYATCNNGTWE